jgi:hypothetical protein
MRPVPRLSMIVLAVTAVGCNNVAIRGSGHITTESRPVSGITGVAVSGEAELILDETGTESLTIEADDNLLAELTSDVDEGVLKLGVRHFTDNIHPTKSIVYRLTVKNLEDIRTAGDVTVSATNVKTNSLGVHLAGAGTITISGSAKQETIDLIGAGRYTGDHFPSDDAIVNITGSGDAVVAAAKTLKVNVTGAGRVEYVGDPVVTQQVIGAGSVRKQGER